jgi:hypothetical protein
MDINWFVFEESYLLAIDYRIAECTLLLRIHARISIDHPKAKQAKMEGHRLPLEKQFVILEMYLNGIQYFRSINSSHLKRGVGNADGEVDLGDIHNLHFSDPAKLGNELEWKKGSRLLTLRLFFNGEVDEVHSPSRDFHLLDFTSGYLVFRAGFETMSMREIIQ